MPETAIHEQCNFLFAENEIGFSENWLVSTPTSDLVQAKQLHQCEFGVLIVTRTDAGHDIRTF